MSTTSLAPIAPAVIQSFGWDRCAVIATSDVLYNSMATETKPLLESAGIKVFFHIVNPVWFSDAVCVQGLSHSKIDAIR